MSSGPCAARRYRVLLVESESIVLEALRRILARGFDVQGFRSGKRALVALSREQFDVVVVDVDLGDLAVDSFLDEVRERAPNTARVALTAVPFAADALLDRARVSHVIDKPAGRATLIECLVSAIESRDSRGYDCGEASRLYAFRTSR